MTEQNIGAARVHLIVDASDYDLAIARATNMARGFGTDAENAFDKSSGGVRRAARQLLDYVANLGKTSDQLKLLRAAQQGVDHSIIDAAAAAMSDYRRETELATDAARKLASAHEEANRINTAFDAQRTTNAQRDFNSMLGVDQPRSGSYLAEQRRAVSALTAQFNQLDAQIDQAFAQDADIERFRQQLVNIQQTAGKTHYELLQLKADQLGVGQTMRPLIKQIQDQDKAMGHAGLTAKQYEWAMRGLPAQLTDISVGLASGQNPLMVFLQQGGQLKDMFGGITPAAKAVTSAVLGMINPWTIGAAVLGTVAVAAYSASKSIEDLAIAVAKGDSFAGTTEQMAALVKTLDDLESVKLGSAEEAVARLASGGKLAGENFDLAAEAAARWVSVSGEGADEIIGKFEAIAKGPLEAIEAGQVRVTEAQYEHIKSLIANGQHQEAVNELTRIYYDTVLNNASAVEGHLSGVSALWNVIENNTAGAFRALGDYVNGWAKFAADYEKTYQKMVAGGQSRFTAQFSAFWNVEPTIPDAATPKSLYDPEKTKRDKQDKQRADEIARWTATADQAAQRQLTLNKLREDGLRLGQSESAIAAVRLRQEKEWAAQDAKRNKKPKGRTSDGSRDATQAIRDQATAEIAAITTQTRILQSQYDQRQLTVEEYYAKLRGYAGDELAITMRSIEAQKAAVAGSKDAASRTAQLNAQAARAREQSQQRGIDLAEGERKAVQQREIAYRDYVRALDEANAATQREADLEVIRIGMGSVQYNRMVAINEALRRRTDMENELARRVADGNLDPKDAERYRDALEKVNQQIRIMVDGFQRADDAQKSFLLGAQGAWQEWLEQTNNVSAQGRDIMTSALDGFVDATANALNGNTKQFESYFENLHMQILRFIVQQQLTKWLESLGQIASNTEGEGLFGSLMRGIGSLFGGGTKGKDSGAAALNGSAAALTSAATALTSAAVALGGGAVAGAAGSAAGGQGGGQMDLVMSIFGAFTKNSQGGVYAGSGLSAYRNSIVSSPTVFPFARGGIPNIGLMGERSGKPHEAIFPVTRMPNGDFGVRAVGGDKRGPTSIHQNFYVEGTPDRTTREQLAKRNGRETTRAMART